MATLLFTLFSTMINSEGHRSLVMLWPVTFIFYGAGFWYTITNIKRAFKRTPLAVALGLTASILLGFIAINLIYSIALAQYMNINKNVTFSGDYVDYLIANTPNNEPIQPMKKLIASYQIGTPLISRPLSNGSGKSKYYVDLQPQYKPTGSILLEQITAIGIITLRGAKHFKAPVLNATINDDLVSRSVLKQLIPEKKFGDVTIYRNPVYE